MTSESLFGKRYGEVLLIRVGDAIDVATSARVHAAASALHAAGLPGVVDIVPAYATLAVHFDPLAWVDAHGGPPLAHVVSAVRAILASPRSVSDEAGRAIEIPVCYGGALGPDLDALAAHAGLDADEVIARHANAVYRVAMLGFAPGFPYLLGLDPALAMPRRASPRTRVPAGSVAIGGVQTGIYPAPLPGGWQLIGRTPRVLFDAARDPPSLVMPGDRVRFVPIAPEALAA